MAADCGVIANTGHPAIEQYLSYRCAPFTRAPSTHQEPIETSVANDTTVNGVGDV